MPGGAAVLARTQRVAECSRPVPFGISIAIHVLRNRFFDFSRRPARTDVEDGLGADVVASFIRLMIFPGPFAIGQLNIRTMRIPGAMGVRFGGLPPNKVTVVVKLSG